MSYGAITPADAEVLELVMKQYAGKTMKFLEIGVYEGATARGIKEFCSRGIALEYWGMDNGAICSANPPFEGCHFLRGDSAEIFYKLPDDFDVIFIDGQHDGNHVILDTYHYSRKVKVGGFLLFHDTSPEIQQTMAERGENFPDIPWFKNSVKAAHAMIGFPWKNWHLFRNAWMPAAKYGGIESYQRLQD